MPVRVTPDQFVITPEGITHILTGAKLVKVKDSSRVMKLERGHRDSDHPEEHNPNAVIKMLYQLWDETNHS